MTAANETPGSGPRPDPQTSAAPEGSTAVSAAPTETDQDKPIPLPPLAPPKPVQTTPEQLRTEMRRLDWGLVAVALALAFLLTAFAIRNSDFWMHLATGRLYAHGEFNFGHDPFSYTTNGSYWANHSWLFDLAIYGLTSVLGGPESAAGGAALVLLKALLMTALAWVMLRTSRAGQSLWAPAACTALAFFAISTRLLFQPTLISLLFLGITLYVLQSPVHREAGYRPGSKPSPSPLTRYWLLPVLFVLWVNLDDWFLLGPITVLLYLVGQVIQHYTAPIFSGVDAPDPKQIRTLIIVLIVGLAACLINPHHYHAFVLPGQLPLFSAEIFEQDALLAQIFYSPFQAEYFRPGYGSVATVIAAYYLLAAMGVASFAASFLGGWRWWRVLIWTFFFALSALQARNIPFFAVVAGPITALNLQDFAAHRFGLVPRVDPGWKWWSRGGRIATLVIGVLLMALVWPGWLHADWFHGGYPTEMHLPHRVSLAVETDPSMVQTATQLNAWRSAGWLPPENHGFLCSPDLVNYLAWFDTDEKGGPRERGFCDYRFEIFPERIAKQYVDVRQFPRVLAEFRLRQRNLPPNDDVWQEVFREHHISHVMVNRANDRYYTFFRDWLQNDWRQWALVYMDGNTSIFRWLDPKQAQGPSAHIQRLDVDALAFGPHAERAPAEGPARSAEYQELWKRYVYGQQSRPLSQAQALGYLEYYESVRQLWPSPFLYSSLVATPVIPAGAAGILAPGAVLLPSSFYLANVPVVLIRISKPGPPPALLLALRASRRAVAVNPDDTQTYLTLAKTYAALTLWQEDVWNESYRRSIPGSPLSQRQRLRQIQIIAALEALLRLRPDDAEAHRMLGESYSVLNFYDLALEHKREHIQAQEAIGPQGSETQENFDKVMDMPRKQLEEYDKQVTRARDDYEVKAANLRLPDKVALALNHGLAKKALDLLLEADPSEIGANEARLQLDLLLCTGRLDEVRAKLEDTESGGGLKSVLPDYGWFMTQIDAASGKYQEAGEYLEEYIVSRERSNVENAMVRTRATIFQRTGPGDVANLLSGLDEVRQIAELRVIRGLLALEEGDTATAARFFRQAMATVASPQFDFDGREIARRYLELIDRQASK
jgi:tetratricopeptide (TPR) repeat protein